MKRSSRQRLFHTSLAFLTLALSSAFTSALPISLAQTTIRDIAYCTVEGADMRMDVYLPATAGAESRPVLVWVHGGGWVGGSKESGVGIADIPELLSRGYVVASINYRLAPTYMFPAQIEDVKCAIRSLRANAATYGINPSLIGVWGGSAGGHLVSLLGVTDRSTGFDVGEHLDYSSRVQAVVDYYGPTNLTSQPGQQGLLEIFGSTEGLRQASPVNYVSNDDPPFLIVHGEQDTLVPLSQSEELYNLLLSADVPATLIVVENAGHGFGPATGPINPTRQEITNLIADFFDTNLRTPTPSTTSTTQPQEVNTTTQSYQTSAIAVTLILAAASIRRKKQQAQNRPRQRMRSDCSVSEDVVRHTVRR